MYVIPFISYQSDLLIQLAPRCYVVSVGLWWAIIKDIDCIVALSLNLLPFMVYHYGRELLLSHAYGRELLLSHTGIVKCHLDSVTQPKWCELSQALKGICDPD